MGRGLVELFKSKCVILFRPRGLVVVLPPIILLVNLYPPLPTNFLRNVPLAIIIIIKTGSEVTPMLTGNQTTVEIQTRPSLIIQHLLYRILQKNVIIEN